MTKPGFHLNKMGATATSMAGRLQCVACVIPWKMVFRNTGVGTQLQPVSPDTSLFERRLPGRLRTVEEVPTARGTRRAVRGVPAHAAHAVGIRTCVFWCVAVATGPRACRTVPCSKCDQRGRATWGLAPARDYSACMRAHANAHSKGYPFARSVTPSPRMTWQHIDLCEADSMLADNVALELLLPQHEA